LKSVQKYNLSAVNEALNELFVEDEDDEALRKSIDSFNNFNMIALASKLASRELLEFRRISAYVYRRNKKWSQSIELSKNDRMWKDCIDTADESADTEIIEGLLRFFCASETSRIYISSLHEVSRLWLRPPANAFNKQLYYDFFERSANPLALSLSLSLEDRASCCRTCQGKNFNYFQDSKLREQLWWRRCLWGHTWWTM